MKHIVKATESKTIKIHAFTAAEFSKKLKALSDYVQKIAEIKYSSIKAGNLYIDRSQKGEIKAVYKIIPEKVNLWSFSKLVKKLPEGVYEIDRSFTEEEATQIAIGWELAFYNFDEFKSSKKKDRDVCLVAAKNVNFVEVQRVVNGVFLARDLINTPPYDLGPEEFAAMAEKVAKDHKAKVKIIKDKKLLKEGYESIYTVGKASEKKPHLVDITWGNAKHPKVTLVGKGVTFDTGGLNIKGGKGMRWMKKDMGGAAIVLGLAQIIMQAQLPVRLRVLLPLVENHISDEAFRPSDIIKTRAGITVEVDNTDAEGRLILCEPLAEADSEKPDLLIDVATLTGAARVAVGTEISAYFTKTDKLATEFDKAGKKAFDPVWRLPLYQPYDYMLGSDSADCANSSPSGYAGATTAALFLKKFVKKTRNWLHVDTHAWNVRNRPGRPVGGEAMAMRALYQLIKDRFV